MWATLVIHKTPLKDTSEAVDDLGCAFAADHRWFNCLTMTDLTIFFSKLTRMFLLIWWRFCQFLFTLFRVILVFKGDEDCLAAVHELIKRIYSFLDVPLFFVGYEAILVSVWWFLVDKYFMLSNLTILLKLTQHILIFHLIRKVQEEYFFVVDATCLLLLVLLRD